MQPSKTFSMRVSQSISIKTANIENHHLQKGTNIWLCFKLLTSLIYVWNFKSWSLLKTRLFHDLSYITLNLFIFVLFILMCMTVMTAHFCYKCMFLSQKLIIRWKRDMRVRKRTEGAGPWWRQAPMDEGGGSDRLMGSEVKEEMCLGAEMVKEVSRAQVRAGSWPWSGCLVLLQVWWVACTRREVQWGASSD